MDTPTTYTPDKPINRADVLELVSAVQTRYADMGDHTYVSSEIVAREMQRLYLDVLALSHGPSVEALALLKVLPVGIRREQDAPAK